MFSPEVWTPLWLKSTAMSSQRLWAMEARLSSQVRAGAPTAARSWFCRSKAVVSVVTKNQPWVPQPSGASSVGAAAEEPPEPEDAGAEEPELPVAAGAGVGVGFGFSLPVRVMLPAIS